LLGKEEKNMFENPSFDLNVSLTLLGLSVLVALIILAITRKKFLSLVFFSVLGNVSFLINAGSFMFDSYNIKWLQIFSLILWPIINIYLIIKYIRNKKLNRKK